MIVDCLRWARPTRLLRWMSCLLVVSLFWASLNFSKIREYFATQERVQVLRQSVALLEKDQETLQLERAALRAGGFPAEKAIRERLIMVKPGEKIIFIDLPNPVASDLGVSR